MWHSLLRLEGLFDASAYANGPRARGGFIHVPFSVRTCHECCVAKGQRSIATYVLHQQDFGWCRNEIPTLVEASVSLSTCYQEVTILLSGPYYVYPDRIISIAVVIEEIWFHGQDTQMGDPARFFWHTVQAAKRGKGPSPGWFHCQVLSQKRRGDGLPCGKPTMKSVYGWCVKCYGGWCWDCHN